MFELFSHVKIKDKNIIGTIVDISTTNGVTWYVVENDVKGKVEGGYGGDWAMFDCTEDELEEVH